MTEEGFKRKLAAILSADVEGYSRLMDDNEEATIRTLTAYRTAMTDLIQQYRSYYGDVRHIPIFDIFHRTTVKLVISVRFLITTSKFFYISYLLSPNYCHSYKVGLILNRQFRSVQLNLHLGTAK